MSLIFKDLLFSKQRNNVLPKRALVHVF